MTTISTEKHWVWRPLLMGIGIPVAAIVILAVLAINSPSPILLDTEQDRILSEKICRDDFIREARSNASIQRLAAESPFPTKTALALMASERCSWMRIVKK